MESFPRKEKNSLSHENIIKSHIRISETRAIVISSVSRTVCIYMLLPEVINLKDRVIYTRAHIHNSRAPPPPAVPAPLFRDHCSSRLGAQLLARGLNFDAGPIDIYLCTDLQRMGELYRASLKPSPVSSSLYNPRSRH